MKNFFLILSLLVLIGAGGFYLYISGQENDLIFRWDESVLGDGHWVSPKNENISAVELITTVTGDSLNTSSTSNGGIELIYIDGVTRARASIILPDKIETEGLTISEFIPNIDGKFEGSVAPRHAGLDEVLSYLNNPGVEFTITIVENVAGGSVGFIREIFIII